MKSEVNINPERLIWAIERAGMDRFKFEKDNPKVSAWINGEKSPTFNQLQDFSNKVHVPFGYLFFPEPPKEELPFPFFRTVRETNSTVSLNVKDTIKILQRRQDWLREYLIDQEAEKLKFVGKFNESSNVYEIVNDIKLALDLKNDWASKCKTLDEAVNFLVNKIEDIGIIVSFNGVVENSTKRKILVEDCRGFILIDDYAPFLFVNSRDGKAAQLFTIVHELAHVWLGKSAGFDMDNLLPADDPIEILCDQVAAELLVPKMIFMEIWKGTNDFEILRKYFKVSKIVVFRRALDLGVITKSEFIDHYRDYISDLKTKKEKQEPGGDFWRMVKKRVSITFAHHVNNAVQSGNLLHRDAFNLTSLYGTTYLNFFKEHKQF